MVVAFASLARDAPLYFGPTGILPGAELLSRARPDLPTIFRWIPPTDTNLQALAVVGALASIGLATRFSAFFCVPLAALYLSFAIVGSRFYSFQWDSLMVETLVVAALLGRTPGRAGVWALRLLFLKLYLESGLAKLAAPSWRDLTAMAAYWPTVPLPTPLTDWADAFPFQPAITALTLFIEGPLLALAFFGRRARVVLFSIVATLQVGIILTGNYGVFNYLTLVLAGSLLLEPQPGGNWAWPGLGAWLILSLASARQYQTRQPVPLAEYAQLTRVANTYHLFVDIDPERYEVELLGTMDGTHWTRLPLRYKPPEAPTFVAPYHPRVAFGLWFATLGGRDSALGFNGRSNSTIDGLMRLWCTDPRRLTPILTREVQAPQAVTLGYWKARPGISRAWDGEVLGRHPWVQRCGELAPWGQPPSLEPLESNVVFGG